MNRLDSVTVSTIGVSSNICSTMEHPFWHKEKGWVRAGELFPGDILKQRAGEYAEITYISHKKELEEQRVYNLEVEGLHSYYVAGGELLVHNGDDLCSVGKVRIESAGDFGGYKFKDGIDVDMRGKGSVEDALDEAFKRVQEPRENFYVTKWAEIKNKYGKSVSVEWTSAKTQAQISIDPAHINNPDALQIQHVGYQTGEKKNKVGR